MYNNSIASINSDCAKNNSNNNNTINTNISRSINNDSNSNNSTDKDWQDDYNGNNIHNNNEQSAYNLNLANAVSLLSISRNASNSGLSDHHIISRQASSPHYRARVAAALARTQLSASRNNSSTHVHLDNSKITQKHSSNRKQGDQLWTALDIGGLGLKNLSASLFSYKFLTAIYMNHNQLNYIHPDIAKLSHLKTLDCSGNNISELPPAIGQLVNLQDLLLFDNQIVTLPNEIGMLYQLETLGLDGNPLQNDLHSLLLNEGTQGLISSLREHIPVGAPPPSREWVILEESDSKHESDEDERFTVLCYNILCPKYVNNQKYGYTSAWALEWEYRKELILSEINDFEADIMCLQEVAMDDFDTTLLPYLKDHGNYDGICYPKSRAKTMSESDRKWVDGCATFYKTTRYKLVDHLLVEFNKKGLERPDFKSSKDTYNRLMPKDNIVLFTLLEDIKTHHLLIVTNTQLYWDPAFSDVKLVQMGIMMDELDRFARPLLEKKNDDGKRRYGSLDAIPMLICGDYNSEPDSGVYEYITKGALRHDHDEFRQSQYGSYTTSGLQHPLTLKSGYSSIGEMNFTNYTPDYKGTLDYIFYTTKTMDVTALLGPLDAQYMAKVVGLPNPHFPSDHIPVLSEFRYKQQTDKIHDSRYPVPHSLRTSYRHSKKQ